MEKIIGSEKLKLIDKILNNLKQKDNNLQKIMIRI